MIPFVRPAPLSAWMLPGLIVAYPQPSEINCSVEDGPATFPPKDANRFVGAGSPGRRGKPPPPNPPNIISTGTGSLAFAGVTSVIWISTLMVGQAELSTCPTSCFATTGISPTTRSTAWVVIVQFTFGTFFGTRPKTSRSKFSTISGRGCFHRIPGVVTFCPFFRVSGSGGSGYGLALAG